MGIRGLYFVVAAAAATGGGCGCGGGEEIYIGKVN